MPMSQFSVRPLSPNQAGFTLLELLVVISIIGVLSSVALASLASARENARDAVRVSTVREVRNAMELHFSEFGVYPTSYDETNNAESNYNAAGVLPNDFDGILAATVRNTNLGTYYPAEPRDPLGLPATDYGYATDSTGGYALLLYLEGISNYCKVRVNAPTDVFGATVIDCPLN